MVSSLPAHFRRRRLLLAASMLYLFFGLLVLFFAPQINQTFNVISRVTYLLGGLSTLVGFGGFLLAYLRGDLLPVSTSRLDYEYAQDLEVRSLARQIDELKLQIKEAPHKTQSPLLEDRAALRAELKTELKGVLASDIVAQIEQKFSDKLSEDAQVSQIRGSFEKTVIRLRKEVDALSRRSNVNLVIGVLTTVVAVSLLAYLVLRSPATPFSGISDILSHFIPRISVAVFVEVFSFFFLRLYKSNLEEIKYFQNELTNVDMKVAALEAGLLGDRHRQSDTIIEQLIRTDRNLSSLRANSSHTSNIEAKDIVDVLDKVGKLLNAGKS